MRYEERIMMKMKKKRPLIIAILLLSAVLIYFYLGVFFETGVNYYQHFLKEQETSTENPVTVYKGTTSEGIIIIRSSVMNQTDRLVEVSIGEITKEYVIETTLDCTEVRLFDSDNALIFESKIDQDLGTITTPEGAEVDYTTYQPVKGEVYNEKNPDPLMLIIAAHGLGEVSRGNLPILMFAILIFVTFLVDLIFPDFFLRFKSLNFKGKVEIPKYYRKMQKISWIVVPIFLIVILINALN